MEKRKITLGHVDVTDKQWGYVNDVMTSGMLSPGKYTKELQGRVAKVHNKKYCVALNSGQSALRIALEYYKRQKHDGLHLPRVLVPSVTYISTIAAVWEAGCVPIMCDVNAKNGLYSYDLQKLRVALTTNVDVVIVAHLFGKADQDVVQYLMEAEQFIISDACQSFAAPGTQVADITCVSFYTSHHVTAGYGGAIITDDIVAYQRCWQLINHGRIFQDQEGSHLSDRFTFEYWGCSLKFCDLNAAFALGQLERYDDMVLQRMENGKAFIDALHCRDSFIIPDLTDHSLMMFPLCLRPDGNFGRFVRNDLVRTLNDAGVDTRMLLPITNQPVIKKYMQAYDFRVHEYPAANAINDNGFYFGCHHGLTTDDMKYVASIICNFMEDL